MKMQPLGSALVPVMLLMACGGDGGGGGDVDLGVDDSKVIEDLSGAEAMKICERLQDVQLVELNKEQECTLGAVLLSMDATQCGSFRDQCIAQPDDGSPEDGDDGDEVDCSDDNPAEREGCKATVGEFEACINATADQFEALKDLTCSDAGKVTQEDLSARPEACTSLTTKCPNLLDDDGAGDEDGSGEGSLRKAHRALGR